MTQRPSPAHHPFCVTHELKMVLNIFKWLGKNYVVMCRKLYEMEISESINEVLLGTQPCVFVLLHLWLLLLYKVVLSHCSGDGLGHNA